MKLLISDKDKPMIQTNVHQPIEGMFVNNLPKMMHFMHLQISLILQAAKQHSCVYILCFHVLALLLLYFLVSHVLMRLCRLLQNKRL